MKPPIRYRLALLLLSPIIVIYIFISVFRRGGSWRFLRQRLGFTYSQNISNPIWLHAASVGEVNAALPLLLKLAHTYATDSLLVTTNTATAATILQRKMPDHVQHCYLPLDFKNAVNRFLQRHKPRCALIMETELWPNLFYGCHQANIPICIINARLSIKTLNAPSWTFPILSYCLQPPIQILTRSEKDRQKYLQLGALDESINVVGNIKYATSHATDPITLDIDRPYVLAASTHAGEEDLLLATWRKLDIKDHLLVMVPRYPERREEIIKLIQNYKFSYAVRSKDETVESNTQIYLADTMGELVSIMQGATIVFMGGSLVPRGGQNIIEPARLGKAIITGPHTFTFEEDVAALTSADAIIQVKDASELASQLRLLLQDRTLAERLGHNAGTFIATQANVLPRYLEQIENLLNDRS